MNDDRQEPITKWVQRVKRAEGLSALWSVNLSAKRQISLRKPLPLYEALPGPPLLLVTRISGILGLFKMHQKSVAGFSEDDP